MLPPIRPRPTIPSFMRRPARRAWRGSRRAARWNESSNFCTPSASSVSVTSSTSTPMSVELAQERLRLVEPLLERERDLAVVLERLDRLERHRVHRLRADQALDVEHVAVVRVLRRGRRPEAPLLRRALRREELPALAREHLLPVLVGEACVRDRRACREAPGRRSVPIASSRMSASVSTRETKKLATDETLRGSPPAATSRSSPRM